MKRPVAFWGQQNIESLTEDHKDDLKEDTVYVKENIDDDSSLILDLSDKEQRREHLMNMFDIEQKMLEDAYTQEISSPKLSKGSLVLVEYYFGSFKL